jgi:hypothetical protein
MVVASAGPIVPGMFECTAGELIVSVFLLLTLSSLVNQKDARLFYGIATFILRL